jgi:hypothetical protein
MAQLFYNGNQISQVGPPTAANAINKYVAQLLPTTSLKPSGSGNHQLTARFYLVDNTSQDIGPFSFTVPLDPYKPLWDGSYLCGRRPVVNGVPWYTTAAACCMEYASYGWPSGKWVPYCAANSEP